MSRLALLLASICVALVGAEFSLYALGTYDDAARSALVRSEAIWERPTNVVQYRDHPDLKYKIEIRFDRYGVRNHSQLSTKEKKNIIAVFGDSFTENRRIDNKFGFTYLLGKMLKGKYYVVNFGVDGYGLDQSYLRYKKFSELNIKHVIYVLYSNDLSNLYETGLVEIREGQVYFRAPRYNWLIQTIGKIRLTYLIIDAFHHVKRHIGALDIRRESFFPNSIKGGYRKRRRNSVADSMIADFLSKEPNARTTHYADVFINILKHWRSEAENSGAKFTVVVVPDRLSTALARKMRVASAFDVVFLSDTIRDYSNITFRNDRHWNEIGNLRSALALARSKYFQSYVRPGLDLSLIRRQMRSEIERLYQTYGRR